MKPSGATWLVVLVSLTLLFAARRAAALVMVMEGYACATLVLAADQTIICSSQVSGAHEEELFALDAATGRIVWREKGKRFYPVALRDKAGAFYVVDDDVLQKRNLSTGGLFWESRLNTITQQNTPPPRSVKEIFDDLVDKLPFRFSQTKPLAIRLNPWTGSPNYYRYRPFLSEEALFVFREASGGGGCVRYHCFNDWIRLNPKSGQQTDGGSGALLGETRGSAVFKNDFATYCVKKGRLSQIEYPGVTNRFFSSSFFHSIGREQYWWRDKCIFTDAINGLQTVFVFDGQKSEGYSFVIPESAAFQTDWVLLDQVRSCVIRSVPDTRNTSRTKADAFFELYDLQGQFVARKEAQMPDRNWYVRFLGISAGGKVYFDWQERISLEIPSLKVGSVPRSLTANRAATGAESHLLPGSNRLYEIHGDTWLSKMDQPQLPHDLLITASDIETGATLWQHTERVMMKKVP